MGVEGPLRVSTGGEVLEESRDAGRQAVGYEVDSGGLVTTTTYVGPLDETDNYPRWSSITKNMDGSTASESSPDPAGGTLPVVRTYQYATNSAALLRITSSASNTADQVQLNPASSNLAAMGHYSLTGTETDGDGPVIDSIDSTDRLTETSTSYVKISGVWNRQTVSRVFHTDGSDTSYTRTTLEALAPVTSGQGLRWISSTTTGTTPGTHTVTTTRDSFFNDHRSVLSTDDSATAVSPDSVTISRYGREVSNSAYGSSNPETMAYDAAGRLIRQTSATGAGTTYTYNPAGQLATSVNHIGKTTSYTYHPADDPAAGLPWTTTNPEGETVITAYNKRGQVVETSGTGTYRVSNEYNEYGEKERMLTYRSTETNATGDLTQWSYDPATGLLHTKTDAGNNTTTYAYYSSGLMHTRVWARPGSVTTTYTYNAFGDLTNKDYSDSAVSTPAVTITPDRLGRPSQIADASGTRTLTYHTVTGGLDLVEYNANSLLPSLKVDYTWDTTLRPAGYAVSAGGPSSSTLAYDDKGRLDTVTSNGSTYTHGYIPGTGTLSSLTTTRESTQVLTRTLYHDRMQRLTGIANTKASVTISRHGYTLDGAGRRLHATRENGQRWDYGYDDVGQVTSAVKKFSDGTTIPGHTFGYEFDGIGNRTSATHGGTGNGVTYTPNALNKYSNISNGGGRFILGEAPVADDVYINDAKVTRSGGQTFFSKHIAGTNTSPLWSLDTITSNNVTISGHTWTPAASVAPVHDEDGNLTFDGRWDYSWDAENRLVRMQTTETVPLPSELPRQRLDFVYDYEGRRVSKTVSTSTDGTTWTLTRDFRFLYDGWNLIAEYEAAAGGVLTTLASHVWGLDLSGTLQGAGGVGGLLCSTLSTGGSFFPAYDGNGNVSAWVDESGSLVGRMDYSPFGQLITQYKFTQPSDTSLSRLPFGFSTKYTDKETGLLYYGYRYYDPVNGRWPSRDPIEERGGVNLYGFVGNDGVGRIDELGMVSLTIKLTDIPSYKCKGNYVWAAFNYVFDDLEKNKDYFLETAYDIDHKVDNNDGKGWQDGTGTGYTLANKFTATGTKLTVSRQSPLNQGEGWTLITYPLQKNKNKFTIKVDPKLYVSNAALNKLSTRNPGLPPGFHPSDPTKSEGQYSDAHDYGANHSSGYLNDDIPSDNKAVASSSTTLTMEIDCCKGTATYSSDLGLGDSSLSQKNEVTGAEKMTKSK